MGKPSVLVRFECTECGVDWVRGDCPHIDNDPADRTYVALDAVLAAMDNATPAADEMNWGEIRLTDDIRAAVVALSTTQESGDA